MAVSSSDALMTILDVDCGEGNGNPVRTCWLGHALVCKADTFEVIIERYAEVSGACE